MEAHGVLQDGLSKIEHPGPLRSATLGCDRNLFEFCAAFRRETCSIRVSCACRPRNASGRR